MTTVYGDGDLRINFNGSSFTLNPLCCSSVPKHHADIHNTIAYHNMEDATSKGKNYLYSYLLLYLSK